MSTQLMSHLFIGANDLDESTFELLGAQVNFFFALFYIFRFKTYKEEMPLLQTAADSGSESEVQVIITCNHL